MALILPALAGIAADAGMIASIVLLAKISIFAHKFLQKAL